jgi:hypothetical protein
VQKSRIARQWGRKHRHQEFDMNRIRPTKFPWLGLALSGSATVLALVLLAPPSTAKDPGGKTAQGVQETKNPATPQVNRLLPKLSEAEQQVEAALAKQVTCKYVEKPLSQVVEDLAKQVDLPMELDPQGLEEAGIDQATPITLEAGPLSLQALLQLLEVRHQLAYAPSLAGLKITSLDAGTSSTVSRVYPIFDLLVPADDNPLEDSLPALIDALTTHVDSDSWNDNGGMGSIVGYRGRVAVDQTLARHHDVAAFLTGLRKLKQSPAPEPGQPLTVIFTAQGPAHEALGKRLTGEATSDLNAFLEQMGAALKIPLVVSLEGLENAGVDLKAEIHGAYRDQPGGKVLKALLEPRQLAPVVFPEFVLITSSDEADQKGETRFYRLDDIVDPDRASGPFARGVPDLEDLIVASVEPDSWRDNGGPGAISSMVHPAALVVTARFDVHAKIEQLLTSFRETSQDKAAVDRKSDERIVQKVYPLYLARRQLKVELARPKVDQPAAPATTPAANPPADAPAAAPAAPAKVDDEPTGGIRRDRPDGALAQFGGMGGMGMGGMGGLGLGGSCLGLPGMAMPAQVTDPIPKAEEVAELIRELLDDPSWKEEGVLLKPFHDTLIIRQRPPMLRKIEKLLQEIDAWHAPMPAVMQRPMMGGQIIPVVGGGGGFF